MKKAEVKVIRFDENDVIATSAAPIWVTVQGLYDNIAGNATITYNGNTFTNNGTNGTADVWLNETLLPTTDISPITTFAKGTKALSISLLFGTATDEELSDIYGDNGISNDARSTYNGTYKFNGTNFIKQ